MDPATISALSGLLGSSGGSAGLVGTATALPRAGLGLWQLYQANKYRKTERPEYETPKSQMASLDLAKREATRTRLPSEDILKNELAASTASGARTLKETQESTADIAAGLNKLVAGEQRQLSSVRMAAEEMRNRNLSRLQVALGQQASFEDKEFELNEYQPYLQAMQAAAELSAAGTQNIFGGIDQGVAAGMTTYANQEYLNAVKSDPTQWEKMRQQYLLGSMGSPQQFDATRSFGIVS